MKNFQYLGLVAVAFGLTACPVDDSDSAGPGDRVCMEDLDGQDGPDVFPTSGPVSAGDYADCEVYTGDVLLTYFPKPACDGSGWSYTFEARGWAAGGELSVLDTAGGNPNEAFWWDETHELSQGGSDTQGWWDQYNKDLPIVTDFNDQVDDTNSFLGCEKNDDATLVWGVELFDIDDQTNTVDCVVISPSATTDAWVGDFKGRFTAFAGCDSFTWTPM